MSRSGPREEERVRNAWVVEFGLITCALVVPFALVAGAARGIPLGWRLIDCSFGVTGCVPLLACRRLIAVLGSDGVIRLETDNPHREV